MEEAGASDGVLDEAEFAGWGADVGVGRGAVGLAVDWDEAPRRFVDGFVAWVEL